MKMIKKTMKTKEFKKLYPGETLALFPITENNDNFVFKSTDSSICLEILMKDPYFFRHMVSESMRSPGTVVDLGGHVGSFSVPLSIDFPGSTFYVVEQDEKNYKALLLNSDLSPNNITLYHTIIKGSRDVMSVELDQRQSGGHKVIFKDEDSLDTKETRAGMTLKELMEINNIDQINFLKMDIEGSEYDVLEKAYEDGIMKNIDIISMEYHVNPTRHREFGTIYKYLESYDSILVHRLTKRIADDPGRGGYHILAYRTKKEIGDINLECLGYEEKVKHFKELRNIASTGLSLKCIGPEDDS
tara:strand:- start:876 stop:1778 length:903 start_codon:yes stop_codon:yes gene_type:complete